MSKWKTIDTAPKDGIKVLLINESGDIDVGGYVPEYWERQEFVRHAKDGDVYKLVREESGWWDCDATCPTHWMELPEPPK